MSKAPLRTRTQVQVGDMRTPLTLLTRSDTKDASGGTVPKYDPVFSDPVWAKDVFGKARQVDQAGKLIITIYHTYTVWFNALIVPGMYLQDPQYARKMYIQGASDPDGTRTYLELSTTDVEG